MPSYMDLGRLHEATMRALFTMLGLIFIGAADLGVAASDDRGAIRNDPVTIDLRSFSESDGCCRADREMGEGRIASIGQPAGISFPAVSEFPDIPNSSPRQPLSRARPARIRFRPSAAMVRRLAGRALPDVTAAAREQWDVAPGGTQAILPGIYLPGQIERIRATEFAPLDHVARVLRGGYEIDEGPTKAYLINDVDLIDGVLYGRGTQRHLRPRRTRSPAYRAPLEAVSGSMYESWTGNRWFGCWLAEDCLTYSLAKASGTPIATPFTVNWGHRSAYNARLGLTPQHIDEVHFDELIVFEDTAGNSGRVKRAREMREKLVKGCEGSPVPGVFLMRGKTGDLRLMANEDEIAQRLATEYGFLILDPTTATVDEIATVCSRARIIAGVEGSHLVHGAVMMPLDATLFVIQPPTRATVFLKAMTDLRGQRFAFVVAEGGVDGFTCDWLEIRRTLDIALAA